MATAMIYAALGVVAFFLFLAFSLKKDHNLIRIVCLIFAIFALLTVPKAAIDDNERCEVVLLNTSTWQSGTPGTDNYPAQINVTYGYNLTCFGDKHKTDTGLFRLVNWFIIIAAWYALLASIWWLLNAAGKTDNIKKLFQMRK